MKTSVPQRLRRDPVLNEAVSRLREMYGPRLKRAVLYGSRARGDHRKKSDYDIAIFLRGEKTDEDGPLADLNYDFLIERDEDVMVFAFGLTDWRKKTTLMLNIRRDGIEF